MNVNASVPTTDSIGSILDQEDVEPWEWFQQVRDLGEVVWDEKAHAWLVTSYDAVLQMSQQDIDVWGRPEQETGSGEWSRYQDHVPEGYTAERWTAARFLRITSSTRRLTSKYTGLSDRLS